MKYAIPYQNERVAGHFSKAGQFLFIQGCQYQVKDNPALSAGGCGGKKSLLAMIKEQETDAVLVRNIGQKMLANLFDAGIRVFHAPGRMSLEEALKSDLPELTEVAQGRPCKNNKQGCGCKSKARPKLVMASMSAAMAPRQFTVSGIKK